MNWKMSVVARAVGGAVIAGCGDSGDDAAARGAYCYGVATLDNTAVFDARDREQTEHEVAEARVALQAVRSKAPADLEDDADLVTTAFLAVLDDIEKAGYDASSVDPAATMGAATVEAASPRFRDANTDICGVELP